MQSFPKTQRRANTNSDTHQIFGDRDSGGVLLGVPQQLHPGLDQVSGVDEDPRGHAAGPGHNEVGIRRQVLHYGLCVQSQKKLVFDPPNGGSEKKRPVRCPVPALGRVGSLLCTPFFRFNFFIHEPSCGTCALHGIQHVSYVGTQQFLTAEGWKRAATAKKPTVRGRRIFIVVQSFHTQQRLAVSAASKGWAIVRCSRQKHGALFVFRKFVPPPIFMFLRVDFAPNPRWVLAWVPGYHCTRRTSSFGELERARKS